MSIKRLMIVQSYEEIPDLLYIIEKFKLTKNIFVANFGSKDLGRHLNYLLKIKNIKVLNFYLEKHMYDNFYQKIITYLRAFIFYKFHFFNKFKEYKKIYFFTPFSVPHISFFIKYFIKNLNYVPAPVLLKKKFIKSNGRYNLKLKTPNISEIGYMRYFRHRIFLGKYTYFKRVGAIIVDAVNEKYLAKVLTSSHLKKNKTIKILALTGKNYQKYNYIKNRFKFKKTTLIYFDQHYSQRNLVDNLSYLNLISSIKNYCKINGINFFYKAHPGKIPCLELSKIKNLKIMDSYIPSEFFLNKKIITVSTSSGVLASSFKNMKISLINLIPFNNEAFRNKVKKVLKLKIMTKIYVPSSLDQLKKLIKKKNIEKSTFIKPN